MNRRPQFENFPLTREQVRTLTQQKRQLQKEYSQNQQQMYKIGQRNIPQAHVFLKRLEERRMILHQQLNWINQIMQTNELLSGKLNRQEKVNFKAKQKSKQLIDSYKSQVLEKRARESFQKQQDQQQEKIILDSNQRNYEFERQQAQSQKMRKRQVLQSYLQDHHTKRQKSTQPQSYSSTSQQFSKTAILTNNQLAQHYLTNQMNAKMYDTKQRSSMNMKELLNSSASNKLSKIGSYSINS